MTSSLYLPTMKKDIARPWFLPSQEALDEQKKLLAKLYFLIKQGDAFGERLRCVKCNRRHDYITLNCVERPFCGIINGLYAYFNAVHNAGVEAHLNPEERSRLEGIRKLLHDIPDFSTMHPETARKLTADIGIDDLQVGAFSMGVLEGISTVHAHKLVQKINDRGLRPKLVLEAPTMYELGRVNTWVA